MKPTRSWPRSVNVILFRAIVTALMPGVVGPVVAAAPTVTFNRHVAPIVFARCVACHRPGGSAPFSLLTYSEVRRRAEQIREVTASRFMPPWLPAPGHGRFQDERRLSEGQIQTLAGWVEQGTVEGDEADLPAAPRFEVGWQLGPPDLVVRMPMPYDLAADGPDVFRNFVIPLPVDRRRYVKGVEIRPGNRRVVHHAEFLVDRTRWARQMAAADPAPGYDGMRTGRAAWPDGHFLGWTPGNVPAMGRADMAWTLRPGTDLIAQLHLQPSGKSEQIQAEIGLYFSDRQPSRFPMMIRIGSQVIDIPAGAAEYTTEDSYVLPVDVEVISLYPHAHYLGKAMSGWALLPDGTKRWLIRIDHWDFNWQQSYRLLEPLALPRGAVLHMRYTFDNSIANVRNPHNPPRRVRYGPQSEDEMGDLWIQVVPVRAGDLGSLQSDYAVRELAADIACYEKLLSDDPDREGVATGLADLYRVFGRAADAVKVLEKAIQRCPDDGIAHTNLGALLIGQGKRDRAVQHLHRALALEPDQPEAHYNLAGIYRQMKRTDDAIRHYRRAIESQPAFREALNSLGLTLRESGKPEAAMAQHRRVLAIDPENATAHLQLGMALSELGRPEAALATFRAAVRLEPDWPALHAALAWALANGPVEGREEAVDHAERAAALTKHEDPVVLDTLAAAYFVVGRLDDAERTWVRALPLAKQLQLGELAGTVEARIAYIRVLRKPAGR